jgi:glutamate racemase
MNTPFLDSTAPHSLQPSTLDPHAGAADSPAVMPLPPSPHAPIGVFDSGIGGLSVLQALLQRLPGERFIYVADTGHAPYGEKSQTDITSRSERIARFLREDCACKALVVACNTATAAAAKSLRQTHMGWPIIGIEPAIKPAAALTRSGTVGVLATQGTLQSRKYAELRQRVLAQPPQPGMSPLVLREVACIGLASAIEALAEGRAVQPGAAPAIAGDAATAAETRVDALLRQYLRELGEFGPGTGQIDTVVLGCTHYPLVAERLRAMLPTGTALLDPGDRVAAHTLYVLQAIGQLSTRPIEATTRSGIYSGQTHHPATLQLWTSGNPEQVAKAARHWLQADAPPVRRLPA